MARDLDFVSRKPVNRLEPVAATAPPAAAKTAVKPLPESILNRTKAKKPTKLSTWVWLAVVLLIVAWAVFFYYLSIKPSSVSRQPANSVSAKPSPSADTLLGAQASAAEQVQVTLYNSGAGADAVNQLADTLKRAGYTSQNLGDSQFQLDQTYIWYQQAYLTDVQKIQALLPRKKVALRPYTGTGPYKILIQLGP